MAETAVSFAVETLGNLLIQKAFFLKGVRGEVEWLRDELKRMQCFLDDATKKQSESESIRNWISDIRKVAHDAEDAIEMFVLNVQYKGKLARYTRFPDHLYHLNKVGKQIESIRRRLKDIEDSRRVYGIQAIGDQQGVVSRSKLEEIESRRRINYRQNNEPVVGLEKDVKVILREAILDKSEGLSVAGILGMGGMGKSTLASKIYNHSDVAKQFDFRAWVVVSSEFKPKDIMKQILVKLEISHERLKLLESVEDNLSCIDNLKEELQNLLAGKRYFIILDDVWEATHWESLSNTFPNEDNGSRLLLTSRNQVMTLKSGYVHDMKFLDDNQSQELFLREVFGGANIDRYTQELKNIGEEILKKCGGLPLAITVVGGLLAKKEMSKSQWEKVLREMKHHSDRGGEICDISEVLELSYQSLPPPLKACFLFLGFFKEDASMIVEDLVHILVAQGLVRQGVVGEGEKMEDVARDYLNELISRNMVKVEKMSRKDGRVKACRMHDLLRDLSIKKAKEEIDFEVVREVGSFSHQTLDKPRHRVIYSERAGFVYSTGPNKYLRSLIFHSESDCLHWDDGSSSYWKSFELLRVLNVEADHRVFSKAIVMLTGLRYINITFYTRLSFILPRSWSKLENLEVLHISCYCTTITIEKSVITKMARLRHIYIDRCKLEVPQGYTTNLQTVNMLWVDDESDIEKLKGLSDVSELGIFLTDARIGSVLFTYLATLHNLVDLSLSIYGNIEGPALCSLLRITRLRLNGNHEMAFPADFPPNLSCLTLKDMEFTENPIPVLKRLPELCYLKLDFENKIEKMVISRGGFPKLKVLYLKDMWEMTELDVEEGALPKIEQLIIRGCRKLKAENLPEHLRHVTTFDY